MYYFVSLTIIIVKHNFPIIIKYNVLNYDGSCYEIHNTNYFDRFHEILP